MASSQLTITFTDKSTFKATLAAGTPADIPTKTVAVRSSRATKPASIVFPSPTSSAMNRLTRGNARAFLSGSS
jgi:hypothetical protein